MLSDERYKQLMESVGMPNSNSLLAALQQCAMEAILNEREQLLQEQSQITYKKYEFCKSVNCSGLYNKCCVHGCYHTAKYFHNWLQENNFKIIKEDTNEYRTTE